MTIAQRKDRHSMDQESVPEESSSGGMAHASVLPFPAKAAPRVVFDRRELTQILDLYGRFVADGEWCDYAMDFGRDSAVFSVFRRASEQPLYRIEKAPARAAKQQQFAVVAQGGQIMKRGNDLAQVLRVLLKKPRLAY